MFLIGITVETGIAYWIKTILARIASVSIEMPLPE